MHPAQLSTTPSFSQLPLFIECSDSKISTVLAKLSPSTSTFLSAQSTSYHLLETIVGNASSTSPLFIHENPYSKGSQSYIFQAYKITGVVIEKFLLIVPRKEEDARFKIPFSIDQVMLQKKAARSGIAPDIHIVQSSSFEAYLMEKVQGENLQDLFKENSGFSLRFRRDLSIKIIEAIVKLHNDLQIAHQDIQPSSIVLETGPDGSFIPLLCSFGLATDQPTIETPLGADLYQPIEWDYDSSLTDLEREDHPLETQKKDLYQLGLTLFYIFKGKHFKEEFDHYLKLKTIEEDWIERMQDVGSLDDFSCVHDDFCRDFLDFKFHEEPSQIKNAIRGLLRTTCTDRISLESAVHLLKSVQKFPIEA